MGLTVRRQLIRIGRRTVFGRPKTEAGRRCISLDPTTVEILRRHREAHAVTGRALGISSAAEPDLVFCRPDGNGRDPEFIDISTRRVFFAGYTAHPDGAWVAQQARNLSWHLGELPRPPRILIRDRDSKFTAVFDEVLRSEGIVAVKTPPRTPRANAFAERWVQSARRECLDRMLVFGERHLHLVMREYVDHYNRFRPHRGLALEIPAPDPILQLHGPIVCIQRLGGIINEYSRLAA
jgi:transposase InsO family protein